MTTLTDTTPEAQRVLDECLRRMKPERKWRIMLDLHRTARALHEAGFRMRHADATRQTIQADWRRSALGRDWQPRLSELPEMDPASLDNLPVLREVAAALRRMGIVFALGGSWASSLQGHARTTYDADLNAEPFPGREAEFAGAFGRDYYVSPDAIREAIQRRSSFNIIHLTSGFKVDVFIRKDTPFGGSVLARRRPTVIPSDPPEPIDVVSPEDIILHKLEWFRIGGEISDRQWGDVLGVLRVQAGQLDETYLDHWAAELGIADLLAKARAAAAPPRPPARRKMTAGRTPVPRSRTMRLHHLALLVTLVAVPARAADATSVQLVPADAAFFTASLRLGEQMDRFLKSNAYAKLKALPAAKAAADHLREAAGQRDNPVAHVLQALKDPANKELVDLLIDMPRQDVFLYGGAGWADLIPLLQRLNSAQRFAPLQALLGGQDPGKAQGRAMLQTLNAIADKLSIPELMIGFKLSNAAPATAQIKRLEEHVTHLIAQVPELKGRLKRTKVGGADALTFNLDGSLIPIESIPWSEIEEQEGEFQKLRLRLKSLTLAVTLLVKNDYLLLTVGPHAGVAEKFGIGPGLASRPELAPMAKFADRKLIAVGYASQVLAAAANTTADDITSMLDMAKTGLDKLPIPEKRREAIDKDLKQLAKAMMAELERPGAGLAFTFLSDRGQETFSYDYGVTPDAIGPKPLTIVDHLGGSPLIAIAGVTGDPTPGYRELVKWLKLIYGHAEGTAKEMFPDAWQQFEQGLDMALPFVKKFDEITGNQFFPSLGDGESALVIDAKWTSKQWHKDFDQGGKDLPMLEIGFVRTVKDPAKLLTALGGYRELANEILEKAKQFGAQAPEGGLPKPQSKKVSGGTVYFWPLPPVGQDPQVQPNLGLSDTLLAAGLSVKHSERLLAKTPLTTDGGPLTEKRPAIGIVVVDFAGFIGAVRPWVEQFALALALEQLPDKAPPGLSKGDIPDQVRTVFDVLGCLRKYTSVTYRDGSATVTHSELVIRDLK